MPKLKQRTLQQLVLLKLSDRYELNWAASHEQSVRLKALLARKHADSWTTIAADSKVRSQAKASPLLM